MSALLAKIRILPKILSLILLLAITSGLGTWYAAHKMSEIDDGYSQVLEADARAAVLSSRINRNIAWFQAVAFRVIADKDEAEMRKLIPELDKTVEASLSQFNDLKRAVPAASAEA